MAKDPAFLWYPNDYIGGTMGMTFEEKGAYVEVLMMQFNQGHLTEDMINQVIGGSWNKIKRKFAQDEKSLWYNVRLEEEQNKRKNFVSSRRNNRLSNKKDTSKSDDMINDMNTHKSTHMEDENESILNNNNNNKDLSFQSPKYRPEDITEVCILATTIYKNTQYPNQVQPYVHNLLAQMDTETVVRAITNVSKMFDDNGRAHDKRPNFDKQFSKVDTVREMAERSIQPVVSPSESKSGTADDGWLKKDEK